MSPTRGSDWTTFLRALALLKRLMQGPASGEALINYVAMSLPDAYPPEASAREAAFKHDREHLRDRLQADFHFDAQDRLYRLDEPGPFGALDLGENSLRGLGILARDFGNGLGERVYLRDLLDELLTRLPAETRRLLDQQPETLVMGVRQFVDKGPVSQRVWNTVRKAADSHRKLSFSYLSPRYKENEPVYFEVAPRYLKFQEGHWYLRGWVLERKPRKSATTSPRYVRFRVTYIQDDETLQVWPEKYPAQYRTPPRFDVHYELAPEIGRGEISHHFAETQITRRADGSAEVRGVTEDIWEAARLLLSYGEGCLVLGGPEVRAEVLRRVEGMARNYGFWAD